MSFTPAGLICFQRCEPPPKAIFGDDPGDHVLLEVFDAAGFSAPTTHFESAKGLASDYRPGNTTIDVEIPANHLCLDTFDVLRAAGIEAAR